MPYENDINHFIAHRRIFYIYHDTLLKIHIILIYIHYKLESLFDSEKLSDRLGSIHDFKYS